MDASVPSIVLSVEETQLFQFLQNSLIFNGQKHITLRVAGGWVRDKLIKKSSNDIDIMVDGVRNIESFMNSLNDYMASLGQARKAFGTIEANPEHGKQGSSCNVVLFDVSVDFVSVRGSSPLDDAECRDLTINAIFYNINKGQVEDLTGKGVYDLAHKILRTPIDPKVTLGYDPLRAVRIARFAAVLEFELDSKLQSWLSNSEVRLELGKKIKRDRIGQEMKKALSVAKPSLFVNVLVTSGLFDVVFLGEFEEPQNEERARLALEMCKVVEELYNAEQDIDTPKVSMFLATCLWKLDVAEPAEKKKGCPLYGTVLNSLRLSHQEGMEAVIIVKGALQMRQIINSGEIDNRLEVGLCLRGCGSLWKGSWILALACDMQKERKLMDRLRRSIYEMKLEGCWNMKPMIDGKKMAALLHITPGPIFTLLTQQLIEFQLQKPHITMHEAEQFLITTYEQNK